MFVKRMCAFVVSVSLVTATLPAGFAQESNQSDEQSPTPVVKQTPDQLQQLVAPIALYPDELVAQVLAAATYPTQVVEADRWLQDHKNLQGKELADEVDKQPWDSSVKALTEFPSVLANMDKNLSWTSSLGDAYMNQQKDVMDAVQVMRQRAEKSGNLKTNSQQKVDKKGKTIVIEPASPEVVYVPTYDPWLVYGEPIGIWPGWYWYPGLYVTEPGIFFGVGFGLGFFGAMVGAGITGDLIGDTGPLSITTQPTSPAATRSSIATIFIADEEVLLGTGTQEHALAGMHSLVRSTALEAPRMDPHLQLVRKLACIPGPSAASITEVWRETIPSVDAPASVDFMVAVASTAVADFTEAEVGGNWRLDVSYFLERKGLCRLQIRSLSIWAWHYGSASLCC